MHYSYGQSAEKSTCIHYSIAGISVCLIPTYNNLVYALFRDSIFQLYALFQWTVCKKSMCMHYSLVKISVCAIPMNVFQVYALFPFSIFLLYALFCMRYSYPLVCVKGGTRLYLDSSWFCCKLFEKHTLSALKSLNSAFKDATTCQPGHWSVTEAQTSSKKLMRVE